MAGGVEGFEFQRLHGMGEALYDALLAELPDAACRVYAPVGGHRDLLAYLVRRLLENGANSSFVVGRRRSERADRRRSLRRPQSWIADAAGARASAKSRCRATSIGRSGAIRAGVEFGDRASLDALLAEVRAGMRAIGQRAPLIDGIALPGRERRVISPIDGSRVGTVREADDAIVAAAMAAARPAFRPGRRRRSTSAPRCSSAPPTCSRPTAAGCIALLQSEGGKTLDDALAEVREAVDFCRYYAARGADALAPQPMPGPTGESNELRYRGRGVFVCISPWNFPLAIFLGQVDRGARRRQCRGRQAGRADAADRRRAPSRCCTRPACRRARCISCRATARSARRSSPIRASPASPSPARPRSAARSTARSPRKDGADRAADRRDRRHQRDDRRCHRAARAGDRRRRRLGLPLRRPALLGAAPAVPAGRRRRAHARDDRSARRAS